MEQLRTINGWQLTTSFFSLAVGQAYVFHDVQCARLGRSGACREESARGLRGESGRGPIARLMLVALQSLFTSCERLHWFALMYHHEHAMRMKTRKQQKWWKRTLRLQRMLQLPQMLRHVDHVGSEVSTTDSISEEIHGDPHFTSSLFFYMSWCHKGTVSSDEVSSNKFHDGKLQKFILWISLQLLWPFTSFWVSKSPHLWSDKPIINHL